MVHIEPAGICRTASHVLNRLFRGGNPGFGSNWRVFKNIVSILKLGASDFVVTD
jgi:hypothetical protein